MLASKHFSGPAKAGSDFVSNKEYPIPAADLPQCPDIARRLVPHPRRSLHQRLNDQRRKRIPFCGELFFSFADRALERFFLAQPLEVSKYVGWRQAQDYEKETLVVTVKGLRIAHAHRAHRISVIGLCKRCNACTLCLTFQLPVLNRHLKCDFDRCGAAV